MVKSKKRSMACNQPQKSWRSGKKRVVKACSKGREKIIHYGATGYGHNYNPTARKSFRARHRCSTAKDKLTARYWACKNLWTKGGDRKSCPKGRKCKRKSPRRKSRSRKRKSPRRKSRSRKRKSPRRKSRRGSRRRM
jgi:arginine/serine-rich splicing factor 12